MSELGTPAPVSVIIPSYMRRPSLLNVIADLAGQTLKPEQVFVIDASPGDLQIHKSELPSVLNIQLIDFKNSPNASAQRNMAIAQVTTPWILFLDDDVRFDSNLIAIYMELTKTFDFDAISGLVRLPKYDKYYVVRKTRERLRNVRAENYQGSEQVLESYVICTANFFTRTEVVKEVGGFDENITGTIDDVDLALRLREKNHKIIHHPLPEVLHLQIRNSGARSFGNEWAFTNLFYFQYRHFENPQSKLLLLDTLWHLCRPSRDWLRPHLVVTRIRNILFSHHAAVRRIQAGPKFIEAECISLS